MFSKTLTGSLFIFLAGFYSFHAIGQTPSLAQLFYPNITLKADFMPETTLENGHKFGLNRTNALAIIPLNTTIQAGIGFGKKADIEAKHSLLLANLAQINTTLDGKEQPNGGYKTAGVTFIQLKASLREKFWVYGIGGGITQSNETFFNPQPYFYGGAARLRILGLKTQILYGTAIVYNQKFRIIPIFGFTKALGDDWKISGILPFRASLTYKVQPWLHVDFNTVFDGYSGGFQDISTTSERLVRRQNYQQVRFTLAANAHVLNAFNIALEGGIAGFRQVRTFNAANETLTSSSLPAGAYMGVSLRYITSKSKISSKFFKKTGLDF
jgi:hypothetical protein